MSLLVPACPDGLYREWSLSGMVFIGNGLYREPPPNREIGYWLGVKYNGQGIATETVAQIVSIAFNNYNLLRVYADVFSNNPSSARVLEKNGFVLEEKLKKIIIKNKKNLDLLIFPKINTN